MKFKLIATACLAGFVLVGCQTNHAQLVAEDAKQTETVKAPKYQEFIQSGDLLPIREIKDVEGRLVNLSSSEKQKLVILFATWCSDSNRALKALNKSDLLNDDSIEIIAIAREEDEATVKAWRDKFDIKVPLAVDVDRSIYKQFAVGGIPRMVTVSNENKVIKMNLAEGDNQLDLIEWN